MHGHDVNILQVHRPNCDSYFTVIDIYFMENERIHTGTDIYCLFYIP